MTINLASTQAVGAPTPTRTPTWIGANEPRSPYRATNAGRESDQIEPRLAALRASLEDLRLGINAIPEGSENPQLLLNFGDNGELDLGGAGDGNGADERFTFRLEGNTGDIELTFASGTTVDQIAATINSFTDKTSIQAELVTSGSTNGSASLRLTSLQTGPDAYVGIKTIDDGNIAGGRSLGVYQVDANGDAIQSTRVSFSDAKSGVFDTGDTPPGAILDQLLGRARPPLGADAAPELTARLEKPNSPERLRAALEASPPTRASILSPPGRALELLTIREPQTTWPPPTTTGPTRGS